MPWFYLCTTKRPLNDHFQIYTLNFWNSSKCSYDILTSHVLFKNKTYSFQYFFFQFTYYFPNRKSYSFILSFWENLTRCCKCTLTTEVTNTAAIETVIITLQRLTIQYNKSKLVPLLTLLLHLTSSLASNIALQIHSERKVLRAPSEQSLETVYRKNKLPLGDRKGY